MLMWSPSNAYGQYGGVPMRFARRHSAGNARTLLRAASRAVVFHFAVKIVLVAAHDAHVDELAGPQAGVAAVLDLDPASDLRCVGHRARDRSEERRVGDEGVSTSTSRWTPKHTIHHTAPKPNQPLKCTPAEQH